MFLLPTKISSASKNMAADIFMLDFWPLQNRPRLRFYDWSGKCATCGISQNPLDAAKLLPDFDICKRPSGGGVVNHLNSITYALVAPRGTKLCEMRAVCSYEKIHATIVDTLALFSIQSVLNQRESIRQNSLLICFSNPAKFDVMSPLGRKIAGAAQKRNKNGMLVQGSISKESIGNIDFESFKRKLAENFAALFGETTQYCDMPQQLDRILVL